MEEEKGRVLIEVVCRVSVNNGKVSVIPDIIEGPDVDFAEKERAIGAVAVWCAQMVADWTRRITGGRLE